MGAKGKQQIPAHKINAILEARAAGIIPDNYTALGKQAKISANAVKAMLHRHQGVVAAMSEASLADIKDRLRHTRDYLLASLSDPEAMREARLRERALAFGIVQDKLLLESGRPTQHLAIITRQEVENLDELAERLSKAILSKSASDTKDLVT